MIQQCRPGGSVSKSVSDKLITDRCAASAGTREPMPSTGKTKAKPTKKESKADWGGKGPTEWKDTIF